MTLQMNPDRRWWRVAGTLAVTHVVLVFAGISLQKSPELGASAATREADFAHSSMVAVFGSGYVEYLGALVFLVAALLIARLLRGEGELAGWLSSCVGAAAVTWTAVTVGTGFPAGAAALYEGHRGVGLDILTTVNDVRNFAFYLAVGVLGAFSLAVAGAIRATGFLPRWLSHTGFVVGTLCLAAPALQGWNAVNLFMLPWFVWFVALGIVALRGPRPAVRPSVDRASAAV